TSHRGDICPVRGVPLLDRQPRVAPRQTLCLCRGEVDLLAGGIATVVGSWRRGPQIPPRIGGERNGHLRQAHTGDVVAVSVCLWHQVRIWRGDELRRQDCQDALVEERTEIEEV